MKLPELAVMLCSLTWLLPAAAADKPAAGKGPFDSGQVIPARLTIPADEYAAMQPRGGMRFPGAPPAPKAPEPPADPNRVVHRNKFGMDLPWAKGSAVVGGQTFRNVGIRYKGNGTIWDASRTIKKSFKVDLDRFGGTGRFAGSKTINLHCGVTDPSKLRETLGYELFRAAGVPAPKTALAEVRLTVPGKYDDELLGLYTIVEEVDSAFLRSRFGTDAGLLMKPEGLRDFEDRGDDWERYKRQYLPKREATREEAARVIAFARLAHKADDATFRKEIGSYLDVDGYLRFLAVTSFTANTDSFFVLGHNYCLYLHPKTSKIHFIPWDLDRALANFPILGTNGQQMDLSLTHPYAGPHRLTDRLLADPEIAARYQKLLKELAATAFDKDRLLKRLGALEATTREHVAREAKAAAARKEASGPTTEFIFGRPPSLRTFFERRTKSVAAQVAGTSKGFVPTGGFGFGGPPKIGPMMAGPMMDAMDADADGLLARDEWLAAAKRLFAACTQDGDGRVDPKALLAGLERVLPKPPADAPGPPGGFNVANIMAGPIMSRGDADKDGKLTLEELLAAAGKIFDEFDREKAGKIDDAAFGDLLTALFPMPRFGPPPAPPKDGK